MEHYYAIWVLWGVDGVYVWPKLLHQMARCVLNRKRQGATWLELGHICDRGASVQACYDNVKLPNEDYWNKVFYISLYHQKTSEIQLNGIIY